MRFGLLFERFLNPERVTLPDFDIDFCQERRDEVIGYVQSKYGRDRVAQIITFGTLQARAVLRDVGRVLGLPYGQVDRLCKLVPAAPGKPVTLAEAIEREPRLKEARDSEEGVARLLDIGQKLEGLYRHASTHAAGVVIADRPLDELVPLYRDPRSDIPVTQFSMNWVESAGLIKFDFLGLKTLTVIAHTEQLLARRGIALKTAELDFDDERTYALLSRGDTIGVFQVESAGMRDLLRQLKPDRIEDLIALVALYRPGPMESIPKFIACKHGREEPIYLHPLLEPILSETYGVMTYQEDVMRIARSLAGYSLGEADLLRRAMGKKKAKEMAEHRARFIAGAAGNAVSARDRGADFRAGGEIRGLRLQQGPRRGLRACALSDGLSQGELSGGVHGRHHDPGHRQHRSPQCLASGAGAAFDHASAARCECVGSALRGRGWENPLCAGRAQECGRAGHGSGGGRARRGADRFAISSTLRRGFRPMR